jgi:hypothetical protein
MVGAQRGITMLDSPMRYKAKHVLCKDGFQRAMMISRECLKKTAIKAATGSEKGDERVTVSIMVSPHYHVWKL